MRAALYLRTSTSEQHPENQRRECVELAQARGASELVEYVEQESARHSRPVLNGLLEECRRGRYRLVVVWRLDRLERSTVRMISTVLELDRLGARVVSVRDSWLDTSGPARPLLLAVFGWLAEMEVAQMSARTRAGMERARAQGKRIGRPPVSPVLLSAAVDRVSAGWTVPRAAQALGLRRRTLYRAVQRARKGGAPWAPRAP